jgi:EAL domain-containing protein (putative c-di-GMP-specific phosphodiesterase class I)
VNLSALHFSSRRIIDWTRDALHRSGLPPHLLTLEITETLELRNWDLARPIIDELHALGCKIAIDDFGAGVSSLAYLRTTKADELKIDRSLVEEIEHSEDARLLLSSVFDIAHNLNLIVTVEGIETEAQSIILQDMGAPHGQGYLFGKPRPPDEALNAASVFAGRITQSGAA